MKVFWKIIICIIVVAIAIGAAYLIKNKSGIEANTNLSNINNNSNAINNQATENNDYIGIEENVEPVEDNKKEEYEETNQTENEEPAKELTGEEKAVDIVKTKYATNGQTVSCDHMEGANYVIKVKDSTAAVTWYLVDGKTWEAEEY